MAKKTKVKIANKEIEVEEYEEPNIPLAQPSTADIDETIETLIGKIKENGKGKSEFLVKIKDILVEARQLRLTAWSLRIHGYNYKELWRREVENRAKKKG